MPEEHPQPLLSCADDSATVATPGNKLAVDVDVFCGEDALEAYVHTEEQFGQDVGHICILDVRRSVLPADTAQGRGVLRGLASGTGIGPIINVIITTQMCVPLMVGHSFPPTFVVEGQPAAPGSGGGAPVPAESRGGTETL